MIKTYKDQIAVVTGAAYGIGRALALGCAERGSDVLCVDIHGDVAEKTAEEIRAMGRKAVSMEADVSLIDDCKKIFDKCMAEFGRCDILINNAGVSTGGDVEDIPERDIRWVYETNVYSHWYMMKYFLPQMEKQDTPAQILNVCSIAGLIISPASPSYFSSKHAAVSLSETVYKQQKMKGSKVDISVFCPGFVQTEMWKTDDHRPERYAMGDDPYYKTEKYAKSVEGSKYVLDTGEPLEPTIKKVFDMLSKDTFYILTHDKYDALLRKQGEFVADKVRPIDLTDVAVQGTLKAST